MSIGHDVSGEAIAGGVSEPVSTMIPGASVLPVWPLAATNSIRQRPQTCGAGVHAGLDGSRSYSPHRRMKNVDEVAWAVVRLLSPKAGASHGSTLAMYGKFAWEF